MPRQMVPLTVALEVETANAIEKIARESRLRFSRAARVLLEERVAIEESGWKLEDEEMTNLLQAIVALEPDRRRRIVQKLGNIVTADADLLQGKNGRA